MALEADRVAKDREMANDDGNRRVRTERRGRERRLDGARVNKEAPRRSLMKAMGAMATGLSAALLAIVFVAGEMLFDQTPWAALLVAVVAVILSLFALLLGCLEQRLIEIRLELMMANGGMRAADRRTIERRGDPSAQDAGFTALL